jgi:hypothetical protein
MVRDEVEFEDTGVPRLFQTSQERLDKAKGGPAGGDILNENT